MQRAVQAINLHKGLSPDIVLMDLALPNRSGDPNTSPSGQEAIRRIKARRPEARVLVLTMHDDEGYLGAVLEKGGAGYVLKQAADTELLSAIRAVWLGDTYLHPEHVQPLLDGYRPPRSASRALAIPERVESQGCTTRRKKEMIS